MSRVRHWLLTPAVSGLSSEGFRCCELVRLLYGAGLCLVLALGLPGCGQGKVPVIGESEKARETLAHSLEVWKSGKDAESLRTAEPEIVMVDENWKQEDELVRFEITEPPVENGSHWRVFAKLTLKKKGKAAREERVCYAVTLGDTVSILRSDFLN